MIAYNDLLIIVSSYEKGYHDGLEAGRRDEDYGRRSPDHIRVGARAAYKMGYDAGITAYCKAEGLDEETDTEQGEIAEVKGGAE